ncbi:MAG: hypothetical protein OEN23_17280 [Paracoccaceae bacterium]|nr:hypothetical protein [Paracoccaceae bacterium]
MRLEQIRTIIAVAAGSALVAAVPIFYEAFDNPGAIFSEISILIPLCAAIGGSVAGVLVRPTLGMPNWTGWVTSAAFAMIALLVAAPVGGFVLVAVFVGNIGEPGVLRRLTDGLEGAMFAILYLVQLAPTLFGITAITAHVVLVHLAARKARAVS